MTTLRLGSLLACRHHAPPRSRHSSVARANRSRSRCHSCWWTGSTTIVSRRRSRSGKAPRRNTGCGTDQKFRPLIPRFARCRRNPCLSTLATGKPNGHPSPAGRENGKATRSPIRSRSQSKFPARLLAAPGSTSRRSNHRLALETPRLGSWMSKEAELSTASLYACPSALPLGRSVGVASARTP